MAKATYTIEQVAEMLQFSAYTIHRRCAEGRMFPPPILQRPYRFSAQEIDALLAGELRQPPHVKTFRRPEGRRYFGRTGTFA